MLQKVLKTGDMFNMFNPEGKYGKGTEHGIFRLRVEHIEHIEHFPSFKHFFGITPKKIKQIEQFSCFRNFLRFYFLFSGVFGTGEPQNNWTYLAVALFYAVLNISCVLGTFWNSILYFQVFWHLWGSKKWTYWAFPLFYAFFGLGLCFEGFWASITESYLKVWLREGGVWGGLGGAVGGGAGILSCNHCSNNTENKERERETHWHTHR